MEIEEKKKTAWIIMEVLMGSLSGVIDDSRRSGVQPLTLREKADVAHDCLCGVNHLHSLVGVLIEQLLIM